MYDQAAEVVLKNRKASISLVQRHLKIYNRRPAGGRHGKGRAGQQHEYQGSVKSWCPHATIHRWCHGLQRNTFAIVIASCCR